jgi:hypothetical protein
MQGPLWGWQKLHTVEYPSQTLGLAAELQREFRMGLLYCWHSVFSESFLENKNALWKSSWCLICWPPSSHEAPQPASSLFLPGIHSRCALSVTVTLFLHWVVSKKLPCTKVQCFVIAVQSHPTGPWNHSFWTNEWIEQIEGNKSERNPCLQFAELVGRWKMQVFGGIACCPMQSVDFGMLSCFPGPAPTWLGSWPHSATHSYLLCLLHCT